MIRAAFSGVTRRGRPGGRPDRVGRRPALISRMATRTRSDLRRDSNAATEVTTPRRRFRANPALASSGSGVERYGSLYRCKPHTTLFHIEDRPHGAVEPFLSAEPIQGPNEQSAPPPVGSGCVPEESVEFLPLPTTSPGDLLAVGGRYGPALGLGVSAEVPLLPGKVLILGRNPKVEGRGLGHRSTLTKGVRSASAPPAKVPLSKAVFRLNVTGPGPSRDPSTGARGSDMDSQGDSAA